MAWPLGLAEASHDLFGVARPRTPHLVKFSIPQYTYIQKDGSARPWHLIKFSAPQYTFAQKDHFPSTYNLVGYDSSGPGWQIQYFTNILNCELQRDFDLITILNILNKKLKKCVQICTSDFVTLLYVYFSKTDIEKYKLISIE